MDAANGGPEQFLETVEGLLQRGHAVRFRADGWSMHPAIRCGEMIHVQPLGNARIRTGDVLLYRRRRSVVAHRVVRMTSPPNGTAEVVLRGDAADCADAPVAVEQLLGRVIAVERNGRTQPLVNGNWSAAVGWFLRRLRVSRLRTADVIYRSRRSFVDSDRGEHRQQDRVGGGA
jgi:hypothetical protein